MAVKLSDFATGQTVRETDHVVGYADTNTGGERKWTLANLRDSLITGAASTIDTDDLETNRVLISDSSGKVAVSTVASNAIGTVTSVTGTAPISVSDGSTTPKISISEATQSAAGIMSAADKTKLDGLGSVYIPPGAVMAFAMNSAPSGWLAANGSTISTGGNNAALFAAIGYTYGGSGGSFKLPDLRGYFVRGSGENSDGTASGTFGQKQADAFKSHTHSLDIVEGIEGDDGSDSIKKARNGNGTTGATGGTETRPKNIAMLYCIKL